MKVWGVKWQQSEDKSNRDESEDVVENEKEEDVERIVINGKHTVVGYGINQENYERQKIIAK